jgi:hypothetical protein
VDQNIGKPSLLLRKTSTNPGAIPALLISEISQDYRPGMFIPVERPTSPDSDLQNVFLNALHISGCGDMTKDDFLSIIDPLLPAAVNAAVKHLAPESFIFMLDGLLSPVTIDMRIRELEKTFRETLVGEYATSVERCFCGDDGTVMLGCEDGGKVEEGDLVERVDALSMEEKVVIKKGASSTNVSGSNPFDLLSDE